MSNYKDNKVYPRVKRFIVSLLLRNSGIRDVWNVLKVSRRCVLDMLFLQVQRCVLLPRLKHYKFV